MSLFFLQGAKRVVMADSYSRLTEYIEPSEIKLPSDTMAFEDEGRVSLSLSLIIYLSSPSKLIFG